MIHFNREKIYQFLDTNNFCAMPFFHVAVESNGDVRPCCLGDVLKNDDGSNFNIGNMSIKEVIDHPTHVNFRNSFLKNEKHKACHPCWDKFQNDRFSGRYVYSSSLKIAKDVLDIVNGEDIKQKLLWLEIKAGNRCNLSCRICGLWNSSKWLKETYNLKKSINLDYPEFRQSKEFLYNKQAKWIDKIEFWKNIDGFDDIKIIHLMGGEPLLIDEHYEMLAAITEKFDPKNIVIWYNTNGTVIPSKNLEELLIKFKSINWSLSIDDFGDKFNYQRKGAYWDSVKHNLHYFRSKENYDLSIDTTISIFNIITIHEFVKELQLLNLSQYFIPHYVTSGIYNVRSLQVDSKNHIKKILLQNQNYVDENFYYKINEMIEFMMSIDTWSKELDDRRKYELDFIDKERNESFITTFPEISKLLNYV